MTVCGVLKVYFHAFLIPALDKFKWRYLCPDSNPGNQEWDAGSTPEPVLTLWMCGKSKQLSNNSEIPEENAYQGFCWSRFVCVVGLYSSEPSSLYTSISVIEWVGHRWLPMRLLPWSGNSLVSWVKVWDMADVHRSDPLRWSEYTHCGTTVLPFTVIRKSLLFLHSCACWPRRISRHTQRPFPTSTYSVHCICLCDFLPCVKVLSSTLKWATVGSIDIIPNPPLHSPLNNFEVDMLRLITNESQGQATSHVSSNKIRRSTRLAW
jgi:hypothetical protein